MCFSAEASFIASASISVAGVATLRKVQSGNQIPFASIPLLFAVQQASEGILWIALSGSDHESWRHYPVYFFLIFSQLIWPVWIPASMLLLEKNEMRRKVIRIMLVLGIITSLYLLYCLIAYKVEAEIHEEHIRYILNFPLALAWITSALYFILTLAPLFVSSIRRMPVLGAVVLLSFIIARFYFEEHLISVWCFFAAIVSIGVYWIAGEFLSRRQAIH